MKKPAGVIGLLVLNYIKLGVGILFILAIIITYKMPVESAYRQGFFSAYTGGMQEMTPELVAQLIGTLSFPLILTIVTLIGIYNRKYVLAIVFICLQIASGITKPPSIILSAIMLLIVLISKPTKDYLKNAISNSKEEEQAI